MELKERKDIDEKYKFDLSDYCTNSEEFYDRLKLLEAKSLKLREYKGQLGVPEKLFEFEKLSEEIYCEMDTLSTYAFFLKDVDNSNLEAEKMYNSVAKIEILYSSLTSFVGEELKNLGEDYLKSIIANPLFKDYTLSYEKIIKSLPHLLSERESYLISQMSNFTDFDQMHSVLLDSEMTFDKPKDSNGKEYDLSVSVYGKYMRSKDRTLRENAWTSMAKSMTQFKQTLFNAIMNELKNDDFKTKITNYDSVLESQLQSYNISKDVFDNIINKAEQNVDILKKYRNAQKTALGLDELKSWDVAVNVASNEEKVTFDEAVQIMRPCYEKFGETYQKAFDDAINEHWCDIYPNKNKGSSIYCGGSYFNHPLMHFNWLDESEDMLTFAHEFGHAVQHIITDKAQPVSTATLPWFLIEVPSLTSETVMFKYLYDNAKTNEDKLSYLQNFINTFMGNVYSGCRLAKYEHYLRENIRKGKILDVETASNEYLQVLNKFSGLDYDERIKYNWMSDGHIFVAYYNYVYSLSMIVATAFAKGIYEGNKETLDNFYKFMETGYSKYGLDNLKECGIDLMDDKVYNDAFSFFEEVVNDFCTLCEEKQKQNQKVDDKEKD